MTFPIFDYYKPNGGLDSGAFQCEYTGVFTKIRVEISHLASSPQYFNNNNNNNNNNKHICKAP